MILYIYSINNKLKQFSKNKVEKLRIKFEIEKRNLRDNSLRTNKHMVSTKTSENETII